MALVVLVAALLSGCGSGNGNGAQDGSTPSLNAGGWEGSVLPDPLLKPDFVLTDTSGQAFDFQERTEGYLTYLYFGYTNCPDVCPTHMADIAAVLKRQPGLRDKIRVVFVTVDPDRDTAERLRTWLDIFDESFIGLRGDWGQVEAAMKGALGDMWFPIETSTPDAQGNYLVSHAGFVALYSLDNAAHLVYPFGVSPDAYEHDLLKLVNEGWSE